MNTEPKIYRTLEEAQEALNAGETVRIAVQPYSFDPALLQLALDLQAKERLALVVGKKGEENE